MNAHKRFGVIATYLHGGAQLGALIEASFTVHELLETRGALLKEKLRIVRFARFSTNDLCIEEG